MDWKRVDESSRGVRFVSGGKTLGVFYNSKDRLCHLAEYEPYRRPPYEYICGGRGNFSASNETQHNLCSKCFDAGKFPSESLTAQDGGTR